MESNPDSLYSLAPSLTTTLSRSLADLEIIYLKCIKRTLTFSLKLQWQIFSKSW